MGLAELIAHEAESLPADKQAEILDFIAFLKTRPSTSDISVVPKTVEEIETFLRGFNVNVSAHRFDRDDANAR